MPSDRLDIARRGIAAYNRGDFATLAEFLHEDVIAVVPDSMANAGVYRGHEGFTRMVEHWGEAWQNFRIDIAELIEEGDAVLAPVVQHWRGRGSGVETSMPAVHVMRFRDDRMVFWRLCASLAEARQHAHDE